MLSRGGEIMEKVIRYKCDYCSELFRSEEWCLEHEESHRKSEKITKLEKSKNVDVIWENIQLGMMIVVIQ